MSIMKKGKLYLIPVPLGEMPPHTVLPKAVCDCASGLSDFVAENAKSARAFLKQLELTRPLQEISIQELNEHTAPAALAQLLAPLLEGKDVGLISEAGCPAVADPGANLVDLAHRHGIQVLPMIGPSSILLALMASGLSGQNFAFHGYLPAKGVQLQRRIRELEIDSKREKRCQIFIETPYRNNQMLEALATGCNGQTRLCVATDLTLASESVRMQTISDWRRAPLPDINRRPTVFLLQA